jgi:hypothetical protein
MRVAAVERPPPFLIKEDPMRNFPAQQGWAGVGFHPDKGP